MAIPATHHDTRSTVTYTGLPGWVRACNEDKSLDPLPEGIRSSISSYIDLTRASINHARFHPRYVIFFVDDVEPETNIIFRRFELTIPFKVKGFPRSRVRLRVTEERINFIHADWDGEYDGWDTPDITGSQHSGTGVVVPVEGGELRSQDNTQGYDSPGQEQLGEEHDVSGW